MEVGDRVKASVALLPVLIGREAGRAPDTVWKRWKGENSLHLPGIESRSPIP